MWIKSFGSILDESVASVQRREGIEAPLVKHRKHAKRLRPYLTLAQRIADTPPLTPRPWVQQNTWERLRARADDLRGSWYVPLPYMGWLRPIVTAAVLVIALLTLSGGAAYAAKDSLPDSPLYQVKLVSEDVRLRLTFSDTRKAEVLLNLGDRRTSEIAEMVQRGKSIPGNVLSALEERNAEAARIIREHPEEAALMTRILQQSAVQENMLLTLSNDVRESAQDDFGKAIATLHNTRLRTSGSSATVAVAAQDVGGGILNISGAVEIVSPGVYRIGGVDVRIDEKTLGSSNVEPGGAARVVAARGANGALQALNVSPSAPEASAGNTLVSGAVEKVAAGEIIVAGQSIKITPETLLKLKPEEGQQVQVMAMTRTEGAVASTIQRSSTETKATPSGALTYEGVIEGDVTADRHARKITVSGLTFTLPASAVFDAQGGDLKTGARARVTSTSEGGKLVAQRVTVLASEPRSESVQITGVFQGIKDGLWQISGVAVDSKMEGSPPAVGSFVTLEGAPEKKNIVGRQATVLQPAGQPASGHVEGYVTAVEPDSVTIGFAKVKLAKDAKVIGPVSVGVRAVAWGSQNNGRLEANYLRILDEKPVAQAKKP